MAEEEAKAPEEESEQTSEVKAEPRFKTLDDLPESLTEVLPVEAQKVYLEAYQHSWENYEDYQGGELDRDAVAHRDGWHAVRQKFVKDESSGRWYVKGELPEDADEKRESLVDRVKDIFE